MYYIYIYIAYIDIMYIIYYLEMNFTQKSWFNPTVISISTTLLSVIIDGHVSQHHKHPTPQHTVQDHISCLLSDILTSKILF